MPVVILTFTKLGTEIISGIPEFVEITANVPAMIFYTLDGSLPTVFSSSYTDPIEMPKDRGSITLSAVAYFLDGYGDLVPSSVLTKTYYTDNAYQGTHHRRFWFEGITYIFPGGKNIPFWYDEAGNVKVVLDLPLEEYQNNELISDRDEQGLYVPNPETEVIHTPSNETATPIDNDLTNYDVPTNPMFDPDARVIVVDGRDRRNIDDTLMLNGPYMSLRDPRRNFYGVDFLSTDGTNYISGSLTKAHYNRSKEVIVFYYFDSTAGRWIKSIQRLEPVAAASLPPNSVVSNPVVFKWNNFGRQQGV